MAAINTTRELAKVRAKIDAQQQIVSQLELDLQRVILGENTRSIDDILADVATVYNGIPDGSILTAAFEEGVQYFDGNDNGDLDETNDQTALRQLLGQARSLLGELRIEEQGWNQEVNEEKARRKELTDMAKG